MFWIDFKLGHSDLRHWKKMATFWAKHLRDIHIHHFFKFSLQNIHDFNIILKILANIGSKHSRLGVGIQNLDYL